MPTFRRIGVVAKRDARIKETLAALLALLHERGLEVATDAGCAALMPEALDAASPASLRECDLAIVIGGDGTLLNAGRMLAPARVPLLGINQGRLGFMVDIAPEDMAVAVSEVLDGACVEEQRLMLEARIERDGRVVRTLTAVNDIVIRNQAAIRMLDFETFLDDAFISSHRADGIIVATPTGSTAYALSGGGPIIHPDVNALALVPICPHALSDRPVVVSAERSVRIHMMGGQHSRAVCTADGQASDALDAFDTIHISAAPQRLRLIHPDSYNYFKILRNKLHWGRDRV